MKAQRRAWREEFAAVDPARLVFVDESGASTALDRTYGRGPSGVRVDGPVPYGHWKVVTLTAAVRLGGVPESACLAFDGATDTAAFETYVERCLAPALRPGDIVVMDNLSCHKTAEVARLIGAAGAEVRYLPAYSPDLNPIETDQADSTSSDRWCKPTGIAALLELASWCRQHLDETPGVTPCPPPSDVSLPPPLTTPSPPPTAPTVWARLPSDRQRQIRDLLGRLLARILAASRGEEVGHE